MAVGTMIGASIFSIFGLGVKLAGQNLPWAFLLSGIYTMAVAYSYSKLGSKIISDAGPMAFILEGLGDNLLTGTLSVLYWFNFIVSITLFAKGFAGYFIPLLYMGHTQFNYSIVMAGLILFFKGLNFFGSKAVGQAEFWIVLLKLSILLLFIVAGFKYINWQRLIPITDPTHLKGLLNASIVFFLSYMGFGLVTNVSENMKNPQKKCLQGYFYKYFYSNYILFGNISSYFG
jgi:amino acid transporter